MKLRSLHIEDYKVFKDFDIDFLGSDGEPLPIVVLAGVNGSGKTTLLEYIENGFYQLLSPYGYADTISFQVDPFPNVIYWHHKKVEMLENNIIKKEAKEKQNLNLHNSGVGFTSIEMYFGDSKVDYMNNIVYIPVGQDNIVNIKEIIRQKYIDRAFEIDKPSEALKELQNYIEKIFDGLDLTFNLSSIDYNKDIVLFKDNKGIEFDINDLSTGEKTLLSKVLYLFFENYKEKLILIDEPELSLHPSWQNSVLKIYENFAKLNNCQIIIATHSPHIIGSAKNEYLRVLKKIDDKIEVFKYEKSYGLEFDKILTDIMGVENLRTPDVAKDIKKLWELLEDEEYESKEYKALYQKLENDLGDLDKDMVLSRLEIARIKSRNAKS